MIATNISEAENNFCFKYSGDNSNKLNGNGYSNVLKYGNATIKHKQITRIFTSLSRLVMKRENFSLVFAFCFVSLEDADKTLTTIDVQASTPPKQAPKTGGKVRSRIWNELGSTLEKKVDIKANNIK
jgi:hypothetical protein